MTCDEVREQLPEHLLGVLEPSTDVEVRRHLRGCGGCRQELASLGEGLATFSRAAHQTDPPEALRDRVLAVLKEERAETERVEAVRQPRRQLLVRMAVAASLVGALAWGTVATVWGVGQSDRAGSYEAFLNALGGRDVRVATLENRGPRAMEGSAVLYDSDVGQSWVLVLVRAPGFSGHARVVLHSEANRLELHPLEFDTNGEASTWLVTAGNIARFDRVRILDVHGRTLATGAIHSACRRYHRDATH
jgi:hypothetical protein